MRSRADDSPPDRDPRMDCPGPRQLVRAQFLPGRRVIVAIHVPEMGVTTAIESELEAPLAAFGPAVARVALPEPVADVVIDLAVVHERADPVVRRACVVIAAVDPVGGIVGDGLVEVRCGGQQMVHGHRCHHLRRIRMRGPQDGPRGAS